jgi:hypothetical protein
MEIHNKDNILDYIIEKYFLIFDDKQLVEKFSLTISPDELKEQLNNYRTKVKVRKKNIGGAKPKEIREEIKLIDNEEKLYDYFKSELISYFDSANKEDETKEILKKYSKEELVFLYKIISNVPLQKSKKKEDILWLIKNYFDNKSRVEAMRL